MRVAALIVAGCLVIAVIVGAVIFLFANTGPDSLEEPQGLDVGTCSITLLTVDEIASAYQRQVQFVNSIFSFNPYFVTDIRDRVAQGLTFYTRAGLSDPLLGLIPLSVVLANQDGRVYGSLESIDNESIRIKALSNDTMIRLELTPNDKVVRSRLPIEVNELCPHELVLAIEFPDGTLSIMATGGRLK